ncbi:MAG: DUF4080 domain-containing protein [Clostridia bacterium]|nr:DUF4080 domain-containing protein [Clostridia bacterium]
MNTVLTALNARFAHSSLALRYLKRYNSDHTIILREFSINDSLSHIYHGLLQENADIYGFSCYLWNVELTLKTAEMLKLAKPDCLIFLGGPEAGYRAEEILNRYAFVDGVIVGEGEEPLEKVLSLLKSGMAFDDLPSISGFAQRNRPITAGKTLNLETMPQPYTAEDIQENKGKILYFETSRGCPFHCAYCLSSAEDKVRPFPMEYVKTGLKQFFDAEVPLVKLIDRTFNYDSKRCGEIIRFILENNRNTCVHMELEPRILTDELIALLGSAPKGMFQVEMGIQSANAKTLEAVGRIFEPEETAKNIRSLSQYGNMHIHLDLIAGLPYEDYESFGKSFDFVYGLRPDMLQLGFLKVLHGTVLQEEETIQSVSFPPYEVVATKWISAEELCRLKEVEEAVELFYNSGVFVKTMQRLTEHHPHPFAVFETLADLLVREEKTGKKKRKDWYEILYQFLGEDFRDVLSDDFIRHNKSIPLPAFTRPQRERGFKDSVYHLMQDAEFCRRYEIEPDLSRLRFERMDGIAWMMDYRTGRLFDITDEIEKGIVD